MELIDNISRLLGDDLKQTLRPGARLKIAASCFSMYAFEALKAELEKLDELNIFTSPAFVANEVTDKIRKERREFHIPKLDRERSLYGSEFEIQLRNKLTQRAVARECADWIRRKAKFRSNHTKAPMQQFACVQANGTDTAYMPLQKVCLRARATCIALSGSTCTTRRCSSAPATSTIGSTMAPRPSNMIWASSASPSTLTPP